MNMIDLWQRLHHIFNLRPKDDMQPEIYIDNLSTAVQRQLIDSLLRNIKEINTSFAIPEPYTEVMVKSPEAVVQFLAQGALVGGLFGQLRFDGYAMPHLGFIFDEPGYMTIAYQGDDSWNGLALIALFEFFREIKVQDKNAIIHLNPEYFDVKAQVTFKTTLQEYLDEKISPS